MCKDLRLADQDEIRAMEVDKVLETEDIPTETLDVPGESSGGGDRTTVEGLDSLRSISCC